MSQFITLFEGHTAEFSDHSLKLIMYTSPPYGDEYIRAKCYEFLSLHPNPVFVDVGASIGTMSAILVHLPTARGVAFEPYPIALECLHENLRLNDLTDRVRVEPFALSDREGTDTLVTPNGEIKHIGWTRIYHTLTNFGPWGPIIKTEVPLRTLDSFEIPKIDVLKIDVEGHEGPVVKGGKETIARCRPIIVVETDPKGSGTTTLLISWGYEIFDIDKADVWLRPTETTT